MALLQALLCAPANAAEADEALRALRRALPRQDDGRAALLFCDLPDAPAERMPDDVPLIRRLQASVMSLAQRRPGCVMLFIRKRSFDDAQQLWLGASQPLCAQQVIAQLVSSGKTDAKFEAVTQSPGSLTGRYDAVLIADASLACTPDTPPRMAAQLDRFARGRVALMPQDEPPLIAHLITQGFSLAHEEAGALPQAVMISADALTACANAFPNIRDCELIDDCVFACKRTPTVADLFRTARTQYLRGPQSIALIPIGQAAALLLFAALGMPLPALISLVLPEYRAALRLKIWPCAFVRAALLPMRAAMALDALLCRWFAGSSGLRVVLPRAARGPAVGVLLGVSLLWLAFSSVHTLPLLLPLSLLWLFSPLILNALELPASERIPLSEDEILLFRAEAESSFYAIDDQNSALIVLCSCAGCMLGLLEPDEAARRVQGQLAALCSSRSSSGFDALECASLLTCAQYMRENMGNCDAALRDLPAQLEAVVCSTPPQTETACSPDSFAPPWKNAPRRCMKQAPGRIMRRTPCSFPRFFLRLPRRRLRHFRSPIRTPVSSAWGSLKSTMQRCPAAKQIPHCTPSASLPARWAIHFAHCFSALQSLRRRQQLWPLHRLILPLRLTFITVSDILLLH